MDDQDVLQHLLAVEFAAAALVDDAQQEADRRLAESGKKVRQAHDEQYGSRVTVLETEYQRHVADTEAGYRQTLDLYRRTQDDLTVDGESFARLFGRFLFGDR